jgi:hypothetical protein
VEVQQTHPWEQKSFKWWVVPLEKKKEKKGKNKGYTGKLGSETKTTTIPRQRSLKCLLVLLSVSKKGSVSAWKYRCSTSPESIQGIVFS